MPPGDPDDLRNRIRELEEELATAHDALARTAACELRQTLETQGAADGCDRAKELRALTRTLSHDLRTPLVAIAGFCSLLRKRLADHPDPKVFEYLERLREATDWVQALLNDLVELLKTHDATLRIVPVDLAALTEKVLSVAEGLPEGRGVCIHRASSLPVVKGDEHLLRRVLENLTQNALRCMKGRPAPTLGIGADIGGAQVTVSISDNGPGIAPGDQKRIFDPFVRLSSEEGGSGLGLAIARRMVEAHGGTLWVESQGDGTGSVFRFTLPLWEAPGPDRGA